jgi:hypothetical protein
VKRALVILGLVVVVAVIAAIVANVFFKQSPPPPPIIPSASPTIGPVSSASDLYREEVRLNDLDVDGADASYEQAIRTAQ